MTTEAENKLREHEHAGTESRKDSEEMPVWAADMMKKFDSLHSRFDAFERKDSKDEGEDPTLTTEGKVKKDSEKAAEGEEKAAEKESKAEAKEEHKAAEAIKEAEKDNRKEQEDERKAEREDRARADAALSAQNRELRGQIAAMQAQMNNLYREPSFEDRNALAATRARADSVYQAVAGRPASEPLPGESPIAYRKRMADGLRKFSAKFKAEEIGGLSGAAFDIVESQIYADAQAAAKTPEVMPKGQLRAITRNDSGHTVTEYIGDSTAAWAPFMAGAAVNVKFTKPTH